MMKMNCRAVPNPSVREIRIILDFIGVVLYDLEFTLISEYIRTSCVTNTIYVDVQDVITAC